jgi:hypothetical protein
LPYLPDQDFLLPHSMRVALRVLAAGNKRKQRKNTRHATQIRTTGGSRTHLILTPRQENRLATVEAGSGPA